MSSVATQPGAATPSTEDIEAYLQRHQNKQMLRFLTCGSVDDGKSTLIGRLLHDTKGIYEDQLAAVARDSVKVGTTGGKIDLALLTDGLKAEREQGITIDVAYRYFSTEKRKFIIADTPGHEQYTRNMATGASTCQLAIILIDARYGVLPQTRRHSFIVSLLGIRHIVVAVNKMDLVGYAQETFERIRADYASFAERLGFADVTFIPLSALAGDNVVEKSAAMPWYAGPPLLTHLETVPLADAAEEARPFRFPVQYVLRPHLDFRGFAGTIASGTLRVDDEIVALPSGKKSRVKSIVTWEGTLPEARAGQAVTVTLADELDISRGDMLVHPGHPPTLAREVEAMVVWMHEQPLTAHKSYWIKQATRTVSGSLAELTYAVDVNTLAQHPAERLGLNEVGQVVLTLSAPIAFDAYRENPATGAFILIDRLTNTTVGAGMILGPRRTTQAFRPVTLQEKEARLGQKGAAVWTTSADAPTLERQLFDEFRTVVHLDARNADPATLEAVVVALVGQGLVVLLSANEPAPPALRARLGRGLIAEATPGATLAALHERGLLTTGEAVAGEGI